MSVLFANTARGYGGDREGGRMPYSIMTAAIERKESLTGKFENYIRHFSPHALGEDGDGRHAVLGFQYDGGRPGGLPIGGDWCCFTLSGLSGVHPNTDKWIVGPITGKPWHLLSSIHIQTE